MSHGPGRALPGWIIALLAAAYPVLIYCSLGHLPMALLGAGLLVLAAARLVLVRHAPAEPLLLAAAVTAMVVAGGYTLISQTGTGLRLYPVLMSGAMLTLFAWSLTRPQTLIERFARLFHGDLPPAAIVYTRRVTVVWCAFFTLNGAIALWTALATTWSTWTLYNGLISYVLIGLLIAGEYLVRQRVMATAA